MGKTGTSRGPYRFPWAPNVIARIHKLQGDNLSADAIRDEIARDRSLTGRKPKARSAIVRVMREHRPQDFPAAKGEPEDLDDYRAPWRMMDAAPDETAAVMPVLRAAMKAVSEGVRESVMPTIAEARAIHRLRHAAPEMPERVCWHLARELVAQDLKATRSGNLAALLRVQRYVAQETWRDPQRALSDFMEGRADSAIAPGFSIVRPQD